MCVSHETITSGVDACLLSASAAVVVAVMGQLLVAVHCQIYGRTTAVATVPRIVEPVSAWAFGHGHRPRCEGGSELRRQSGRDGRDVERPLVLHHLVPRKAAEVCDLEALRAEHLPVYVARVVAEEVADDRGDVRG